MMTRNIWRLPIATAIAAASLAWAAPSEAQAVVVTVAVHVEATKADGSAWDMGNPAPDIGLCVTQPAQAERCEQVQCNDQYDCSFPNVAWQAGSTIRVFDYDMWSGNDQVGTGVCPAAELCVIGRATVTVAPPPGAPPPAPAARAETSARLVRATADEVRTVEGLLTGRCRADAAQSFRFESAHDPLDGLLIAPISCGYEPTTLRLALHGALLPELRLYGTEPGVVALALRDIDEDGQADLVAVVSALHGAGQCAAEGVQHGAAWLRRGSAFVEAASDALPWGGFDDAENCTGADTYTIAEIVAAAQRYYRSH
jgi:hypothetical protein